MFIRILPFLIFGFITITFADSATQTDWTGGPGSWGPVSEWNDLFFQCSYINYSISDELLLEMSEKHIIDDYYQYVQEICPADIDGDGDIDVVGSALEGNNIVWWENIDGAGLAWTRRVIEDDFFMAKCVDAGDIDGDGDIDVLGAAHDSPIKWWENCDGVGTSWTDHTISSNIDGPRGVYLEDVDHDGDLDVMGAAAYGNTSIGWWANVDGIGSSWNPQIILENNDVISIHPVDIDCDDDMDIAAYINLVDTDSFDTTWPDDLVWLENDDSSGTSCWIYHVIDTDTGNHLSSQDIDGDGDMDLLTMGMGRPTRWRENVDGSGGSWIIHEIADPIFGGTISSGDMDGDGDMDVLCSTNKIIWYENCNGVGTAWTEHVIDNDFIGACSIITDINNDGLMDVVGVSNNTDEVCWWNVFAFSTYGSLISSVLDTGCNPDWGTIDWITIEPLGTYIGFQVRSSDIPEPDSMGAWSDTLSTPCSLVGILDDGEQYVQYRAVLSTTDPDTTPVLVEVTITWDDLGIEDRPELIPSGFELFPFNPNPVFGLPVIYFVLPEYSLVELIVYDVSGRSICKVPKDNYSAGYHTLILGKLSPGIYFCRMISGEFAATQHFVVIE